MKMENPATWGPAEKVVDKVIREVYENRRAGITGLSMVRRVTDGLREAGLLRDRELAHCAGCDFPLAATQTCAECGSVTAVLCLSCHPRDDADKALVTALRGAVPA
jgi:hypothetical protein